MSNGIDACVLAGLPAHLGQAGVLQEMRVGAAGWRTCTRGSWGGQRATTTASIFPPVHPSCTAAKTVSPWHEVPLYAGDGCLHYICEIPKETSAKMEVATVGAGSGAGRACVCRPGEPEGVRGMPVPEVPRAPTPPCGPQDEECTPIKQDVKKGKVRFYPYNINWNYGMLPQTWEDPGKTDATLNAAVSMGAGGGGGRGRQEAEWVSRRCVCGKGRG